MRQALGGCITSVGFATGDRFVVGHWRETPIGPFTDVMWAQPSGHRTLLAPSDLVAEFITAVYRFDTVAIGEISAQRDGRLLSLAAGPVLLDVRAGAGWRIPGGRLRPAWWHRVIEAPVARLAMGVQVYGKSPTGVREWYRADVYRPVVSAAATVDGRALGAVGPLEPPCRFGFSEPPRRPSMVDVRPLLLDPAGRLDEIVSRAGDRATSATRSAPR